MGHPPQAQLRFGWASPRTGWWKRRTRTVETLLAHLGAFRKDSFRQRTVMAQCAEYDRLSTEVENVLGNLAQLTTLLLELFRSSDWNGVRRLDKELEFTVGEKERSIGALRQHVREHKCVGQGM